MTSAHRPSSPFTFGVASGDPTASEVSLWTHCADDRRQVEWWLDDPTTGLRRSGRSEPRSGFVDVRVDGLPPGGEFRYGFSADGDRSPEGRTRTLAEPSASAATVEVAVVCCSRWPDGPFDVYRRVAELRPDLVLHLGDYIYQDGGAGPRGAHEPSRECVSAEDYRARYAQYRSDPDLQALHAAAPWVALWDDHEFADDAWRAGARGTESPARWRRRRDAAVEAHRTWMPQREIGNGPTPVDRWLRLGPVADLIAVDCRMAGRERPHNDADGPARQPVERRRLLTEEQWEWLDASLAAATGSHLLLATSVQFSPLRLLALPSLGWPPLRWVVNPDQWDGYPSERRRLLDLLRRHDRLDALVLSGDLHARFHARWEDAGLVIREVTTPSITATPFAELVRGAVGPVHPRLLARWIRLLNPHVTEVDLTSHGATLLTIGEAGVAVTPVTA